MFTIHNAFDLHYVHEHPHACWHIQGHGQPCTFRHSVLYPIYCMEWNNKKHTSKKHIVTHMDNHSCFPLPFWAGWALMKCSWSSFSFCVSLLHRRQHPLAWFLSFRVVSCFPSFSSSIFTPLPLPLTSLTLHSPCLYLLHINTGKDTEYNSKRKKKVWKWHKVREIPPPVQPPA